MTSAARTGSSGSSAAAMPRSTIISGWDRRHAAQRAISEDAPTRPRISDMKACSLWSDVLHGTSA